MGFKCSLSLQISRMHSKLSSERWILDQSSIFAQVDAFVQRCKDLLEVYKLCSVLTVHTQEN